jgi:hypothetical protein
MKTPDGFEIVECRDARCKAPIVWAVIAKSGKRSCFNALGPGPWILNRHPHGDVSAYYEKDATNGREAHWASCPGAKDFRQKGPPS